MAGCLILGYSCLRDFNAELKQLAMDSGSTPQRIGSAHFPNEGDRVWGDSFPPGFKRTTLPFPEDAKAIPMPVDDRAGFDQVQPGFPLIPGMREPSPQGTVHWRETGPVGTPAQDQQLVAQSQVFEEQVPVGFQSG